MTNLLRFPVVLIALLSSLYWAFRPAPSADEESVSDPTQDRLVLRVPTEKPEAPLPPAKQRRKGPRRASIRAPEPHQLASATGTVPQGDETSPVQIRAEIRGITPLPDQNPAPETPPLRETESSIQPTQPSDVTHVIVDGDDLKQIASKYLGNAERYYEIFEANPDVLHRPDVLPLGKSLVIPLNSDALTPHDLLP